MRSDIRKFINSLEELKPFTEKFGQLNWHDISLDDEPPYIFQSKLYPLQVYIEEEDGVLDGTIRLVPRWEYVEIEKAVEAYKDHNETNDPLFEKLYKETIFADDFYFRLETVDDKVRAFFTPSSYVDDYNRWYDESFSLDHLLPNLLDKEEVDPGSWEAINRNTSIKTISRSLKKIGFIEA